MRIDDFVFWISAAGVAGWFLGLYSGLKAAKKRDRPETTITFPGHLEDFWDEIERRMG